MPVMHRTVLRKLEATLAQEILKNKIDTENAPELENQLNNNFDNICHQEPKAEAGFMENYMYHAIANLSDALPSVADSITKYELNVAQLQRNMENNPLNLFFSTDVHSTFFRVAQDKMGKNPLSLYKPIIDRYDYIDTLTKPVLTALLSLAALVSSIAMIGITIHAAYAYDVETAINHPLEMAKIDFLLFGVLAAQTLIAVVDAILGAILRPMITLGMSYLNTPTEEQLINSNEIEYRFIYFQDKFYTNKDDRDGDPCSIPEPQVASEDDWDDYEEDNRMSY